MHAIELKGLRKVFGPRAALDGVDLLAEPGRILGFLGPNGAGKTTAIRIMLGLLRASEGACRVFGEDAWESGPRIRSEVGYLPGEPRFYARMRGLGLLRFLARGRRRDCGDEIERLAERFELDLKRRVREYSSGMKQKLGLIQALMHQPRLLILDEPTNALDPLIRATLFEELDAVRASGRTVLFSSHTLAEVEQVCDDVAILRGGKLMEQSTVESLRSRAAMSVECRFAIPPSEYPEAWRPVRESSSTEGGQVEVAVWTGEPDALVKWLATQTLHEVQMGPPRLDDLFRTYYERNESRETVA